MCDTQSISWRRRRSKWKLERHSPDKRIDARFESFDCWPLGTFCLLMSHSPRFPQPATALRMFAEGLSLAYRSRRWSRRTTTWIKDPHWALSRHWKPSILYQEEDGCVNTESPDGSQNAPASKMTAVNPISFQFHASILTAFERWKIWAVRSRGMVASASGSAIFSP